MWYPFLISLCSCISGKFMLAFFQVVCVLSSDRKERHDGIKKYLCVNCPVTSQCVVARILDKPQTPMTIATKIAQRMNYKMGGALWKVQTGVCWILLPSLYFMDFVKIVLNYFFKFNWEICLYSVLTQFTTFFKIEVAECNVHWHRLFPRYCKLIEVNCRICTKCQWRLNGVGKLWQT